MSGDFREQVGGILQSALFLQNECLVCQRCLVIRRQLQDPIDRCLRLGKSAHTLEDIRKREEIIEIVWIELCRCFVMFGRIVWSSETPFDVSHLLKNERTVGQAFERFAIRLKCAGKIAENTIAVNTLSDPSLTGFRFERERLVRGFFHSRGRILSEVYAVKIQTAAGDGEMCPCDRELWIETGGLGISGGRLRKSFGVSGVFDR